MFCKLSGLVTESDWNRWTPDQIRPYLDVAFDCFGALSAAHGIRLAGLHGGRRLRADDLRD